MTIERRIIVGIEDIKGVCFECLDCHLRITVNPDQIGHVPSQCSRCRKAWLIRNPGARDEVSDSPFVSFASAIERIRNLNKEGISQGFRILLEFEEPRG